MISVLVGPEYHTLVTTDYWRTKLNIKISFIYSPTLLYHYINDIAVCQRQKL